MVRGLPYYASNLGFNGGQFNRVGCQTPVEGNRAVIQYYLYLYTMVTFMKGYTRAWQIPPSTTSGDVLQPAPDSRRKSGVLQSLTMMMIKTY